MKAGCATIKREAESGDKGQCNGAVLPRKTGMAGAFTLVEVILAIALSALLLTIVYWTYFSINRSVDAATESQDALDTGRTLSELIKRDIRSISPTPYPLVGKNTVIRNSSFGELEFVTNALSATDPQRLRRVGYALILSDNDEKTLVRRESKDLSDLLDKSPADYLPKVFEVSTVITGFLVEFYNGGRLGPGMGFRGRDRCHTDDSRMIRCEGPRCRRGRAGPTRVRTKVVRVQTKWSECKPKWSEANQSGQSANQSGQSANQSGQIERISSAEVTDEKGFILVTILLVIAVLFPLILAFNAKVQLNLIQAENFRNSVQALRIARSGVEGAIGILKADDASYDAKTDKWAAAFPSLASGTVSST